VFDDLEARTVIGRLDVDEELSLADVAHEVELHVETGTATASAWRLQPSEVAGGAAILPPGRPPVVGVDPRCRRLSSANLNEVSELFESYYPDAVFSTWMLDLTVHRAL